MKSTDDNKVEIIKPKSKKKIRQEEDLKQKYENNKKYISPILMGIVGLLLLTNSNDIIIFACYVIGALIVGYGVYNIISYSQLRKEFHIEDSKKLNTGIATIGIGLLVILLSGIIQTFLNLLLGIWLIITGVTKLINISNLYNSDRKTANLNLIEAVIVIAMGLYSVFFQNIILTVIGAWMIIGAGIELYNNLKK